MQLLPRRSAVVVGQRQQVGALEIGIEAAVFGARHQVLGSEEERDHEALVNLQLVRSMVGSWE